MKKIILLSVILLTTGFCEDLFELGLEAYNKGEFDKAAKQWQKACDDNVARACHNLGFLYEDAQGVKQDYHKAAELYKRSGDGGFAGSCLNLGALYIKDQGIEQDYNKAIELYKKGLRRRYRPSLPQLRGFICARQRGKSRLSLDKKIRF